MIGLLVNDQAFRAGINQRYVVRDLHRSDFKADAGNSRGQAANASLQVITGNKFWMLASHEKNIAKPLGDDMCRFARDLIDLQSHAKDGVLAGKAAIGARMHSFER